MHRTAYEPELWSDRKLFASILDAIVHGIWRLLKFGGAPFGNILAFLLWCGLTISDLTAWVSRICRRLVKWLGTSCKVSFFGSGFTSKRYHLVLVFITVSCGLSALAGRIRQRISAHLRFRNKLIGNMHNARSQKEWKHYADQLRELDRQNARRRSVAMEARLLNIPLFERKASQLKQLFETDNPNIQISGLLLRLREDLTRKMGNMQDASIYDYFGEIPKPIGNYITEVQRCLKTIASSKYLSSQQKRNYFQETRHAFGRTALLLSGGGSLGTFHLGVIKVLLENDLIPRIVCGSSVGSIIAAVVGCHTTESLNSWLTHIEDVDLQFFSSSSVRQFIGSLLMTGAIHDADHFCTKLEELLGDLTFLEAFEKTGRVLNVVVCAANADEPARVLNYLTAPQVLVWSAVAASSAFPGLFPPQNIQSRSNDGGRVTFAMEHCQDMERRWRDGSLEEDLPIQTMRELFNVNYFIVSQTNPHIVPLLNLRDRLNKRLAKAIEIEWKHRCHQLEWLLPEWVPTKWLKLFTQTWEGDVTMVLPLSDYWTLLKAIVNPTKDEMLSAVHLGEVSTWEKLAAIESNCAIEKSLDACLKLVMDELNSKSDLKSMNKSKIPSWLHLPVLGLPKLESTEALNTFEATRSSLQPPTKAPLSLEDDIAEGAPLNDCLDNSAAPFKASDEMKHIPSGDALNCIAP